MRWAALALAVLPAATSLQAEAQDVDNGHVLAKQWCSNCHVVDRTQREGQAGGLPSFAAVASRPEVSMQSLRAVMTAQHGRMPDFSLTTREMNDLGTYILSLRK
jgi:mono/diheme cytochrome c family protein